MREHLTERVPIKQFYEIEGSTDLAESTCREYAAMLKAINPQVCPLGIGENGYLAFNDPFDADINDPLDVRVLKLDNECRE